MKISEQNPWMVREYTNEWGDCCLEVVGVEGAECEYPAEGEPICRAVLNMTLAEAIANLPDIVRAMLEQRERIRRWQQGVYVEDFCVDMGESLDEIDALLERLGEKP